MSLQDTLGPVIMTTSLEARLKDLSIQVEQILHDSRTCPMRDVYNNLRLIERTLIETMEALKLATQVHYFDIGMNLTAQYREHNAMPRVRDAAYDESSSSDLNTDEDAVIYAD